MAVKSTKKAAAKKTASTSASKRIDQRIADLGDWRGERLAEIRKLIHEVDPAVVEEWKWMGTPVWSHEGMYALANAHKDKVKLTFFHGAQLSRPEEALQRRADRGQMAGDRSSRGRQESTRPRSRRCCARRWLYNTKHSVPKSKGSRA